MDLISLFNDIDPVQLALVTFFCIGGVKLVDLVGDAIEDKKKWRSVSKVLASVIIGVGVAGIIPGFTLLMGAAAGLAASGAVTLREKGTKSEEPNVL